MQRGAGAAADDHQGQQRQLYLEAGPGHRQAGHPAEPPAEDIRFHAGPGGGEQGHGVWRLQLLLDRGPHQPHLPPPERAVCPHRPGRLPDHPACGRQAHPAGSGEVPADEGRGLMGRRCRPWR